MCLCINIYWWDGMSFWNITERDWWSQLTLNHCISSLFQWTTQIITDVPMGLVWQTQYGHLLNLTCQFMEMKYPAAQVLGTLNNAKPCNRNIMFLKLNLQFRIPPRWKKIKCIYFFSLQKHWSAKKCSTCWAKNINNLYWFITIRSHILTTSVGAIFLWQWRPSKLSAVLLFLKSMGNFEI
jgi:hypothetical protein